MSASGCSDCSNAEYCAWHGCALDEIRREADQRQRDLAEAAAEAIGDEMRERDGAIGGVH